MLTTVPILTYTYAYIPRQLSLNSFHHFKCNYVGHSVQRALFLLLPLARHCKKVIIWSYEQKTSHITVRDNEMGILSFWRHTTSMHMQLKLKRRAVTIYGSSCQTPAILEQEIGIAELYLHALAFMYLVITPEIRCQ